MLGLAVDGGSPHSATENFIHPISMKNQINRRHFLRGSGALIALPALESIGFRRFASVPDCYGPGRDRLLLAAELEAHPHG